MKFRDLTERDIDVRIGQVGTYLSGEGYAMLLLYKDARVDMDILDETVGAENWQRRHYEVKGNMYCSVGINCGKGEQSEWVWKDDCGTESNTEKEKGEASDAFKRACVNWGIGRELYTAPPISIKCEVKDKKVLDLSRFQVTHIKIVDKTITQLSISAYNKNKRAAEEVFSFTKGHSGTSPKPINQAYDNSSKPAKVTEKSMRTLQLERLIQGTAHTLDEANEFAKKGYKAENYDALTQPQFNTLYDRLEEAIKKERGNG